MDKQTTDMTVAQTILEQLGGNRFKVMTGAKNFIGHNDGLSFRLPGAGGFCKNGINYVFIKLEPSDTYTVTFSRIRGMKSTQVAQHNDIYFDALKDCISRETGLALSMGKVVFV
jgi:hypothetical protein